jgi:Flp pilus assembly pilin Flp
MRDLVSRSHANEAGAHATKYALIVAVMVLAIVTVALGVWANLAATEGAAETLWH